MKIVVYPQPFIFTYRKVTTDRSAKTYHAHQGMEFLYIHEGEGQVILDQQIHRIKSGTLLYFQPFQLHRVQKFIGDSPSYISSVIILEPTHFHSRLSIFPELCTFFEYLWKAQPVKHMINTLHTGSFLNNLLEYHHKKLSAYSGKPYDEYLEAQTILVLALLDYLKPHWVQKNTLRATPSHRSVKHSEQIMEWIEEHYDEEFQLEQLAHDLHLSKYHISRLFRKAIGSTITEYLIARRMREACFLLKTSSMSIQEIGYRVGYSNISYFSQLFKKNMGLSPREYRFHSKK